MRAVATILLALTTVSCAPRMYDLVPRETSASCLITPRWVGTESTQSSVSASYDRAWLGHLLFEVEVVNRSDSKLVVDPGQFSLTLSSAPEGPRRKRLRPIAPEDPARVEERIARESEITPGIGDAILTAAGIAFAGVIVAAVMANGEYPDLEPTPVDPLPDPWAIRRADASRMAEHLRATLLHHTELAPGERVRGEIWFPARPLARAIGPRWSENPDGAGRITQDLGRRDVQCAATLRAPAALGGQEIDYFVWSD